ncbi:MAG: hypothetical protein IT237_11405 [Bacteroidia bacterium]|nr:hypothetical protein [Bacteroidia bacterium]MCZ2249327.1 hypothetical protein [Bacteroidia bacterium]
MSITSDNSFHWNTKTNVNSPYNLEYKTSNFCFWAPLNFGISAGIQLSPKKEILIGLNTDGNSFIYKVYADNYQNGIGYTFGESSIKGKSSFIRYYINYKYTLYSLPSNLNCSIIIGAGMAQRGGPQKGGESTGNFGIAGTIDENGTVYAFQNKSFTWHKRGYLINFGLGSDVYIRNKYIFSSTLIFTYSPYATGRDLNTLTISNPNTNYSKTYKQNVDFKGTGLYLGVSRRFQIYQTKKIKPTDQKDYFK